MAAVLRGLKCKRGEVRGGVNLRSQRAAGPVGVLRDNPAVFLSDLLPLNSQHIDIGIGNQFFCNAPKDEVRQATTPMCAYNNQIGFR